ncbi:MAG: HAD family hydrolase [Lachnospiraceae bacterium]
MNVRGAIFDFDGTLFDSMFIWDVIGSEYLSSIGYKPADALNETLKAMSMDQAACYFKEEYGVAKSVPEITQGVNQLLEHYYFDTIQLKSGVKDFLCKLNDKGVKLCIATATDKYLVEAALRRTDLRPYFSQIFTCSNVGSGKDNPAIFLAAQSYLRTKIEETIVFEDAVHALRTAKAAGFLTVGIYDAYQTDNDAVKEHATIYLKDFSDFDTFWEFVT